MVSTVLKAKLKKKLDDFQLNIELSVPLGSTVLFGPSGSGKSTILDCLAGLRRPDEGFIAVGNDQFLDSTAGFFLPPQKRKIGYVFQRPSLFPHLTVRENIAFGISHWQKDKRENRVDTLLELLQINYLSGRRPTKLSGGEGQRAALARALAPEPHLLLLDEPFSALDVDSRKQLGDELLKLQKNLSLPMVLVTHSREEALALAEVVVCISAGRVIKTGSPAEVLLDQEPRRLDNNVHFSW
jgi:molybdate transport system ATP-binding protein